MWLVSRFSFSFIAVGVVLMYMALTSPDRGGWPGWKAPAMMAGAAVLVLIGLLGVRHRHRQRRE